jgi:hypothetical protein
VGVSSIPAEVPPLTVIRGGRARTDHRAHRGRRWPSRPGSWIRHPALGLRRYHSGSWPQAEGRRDEWRSTQGVGVPTSEYDPEVPQLPAGGSDGGRLFEAGDSPEGSGDWAIAWADPDPRP